MTRQYFADKRADQAQLALLTLRLREKCRHSNELNKLKMLYEVTDGLQEEDIPEKLIVEFGERAKDSVLPTHYFIAKYRNNNSTNSRLSFYYRISEELKSTIGVVDSALQPHWDKLAELRPFFTGYARYK